MHLDSRSGAKRTVRSLTSARRFGSPVSASVSASCRLVASSRSFSRARRSAVAWAASDRRKKNANAPRSTVIEAIEPSITFACALGGARCVGAVRGREQPLDARGAAAGVGRQPVGRGAVPASPCAAAVDLLERRVVRAERAADALERLRRGVAPQRPELAHDRRHLGVHLAAGEHPRPAGLGARVERRGLERVQLGPDVGERQLGVLARSRAALEVEDGGHGGDPQQQDHGQRGLLADHRPGYRRSASGVEGSR